jgi:hypothetical protein
MIKRIIQQTKHFVNKAATVLHYNYLRLKIACPVKMPFNEKSRTISVAIPHYNGSRMAHVALFNILNDPRIAEIVFLDDGSKPEEFNKLKTNSEEMLTGVLLQIKSKQLSYALQTGLSCSIMTTRCFQNI